MKVTRTECRTGKSPLLPYFEHATHHALEAGRRWLHTPAIPALTACNADSLITLRTRDPDRHARPRQPLDAPMAAKIQQNVGRVWKSMQCAAVACVTPVVNRAQRPLSYGSVVAAHRSISSW